MDATVATKGPKERPGATGSILAANVAMLAGLSFGLLYGTGSPLIVAGATALVMAVVIAFVAAYRFPIVFLAFLVIRPMLDGFKFSSRGGSSLAEPSVAVSVVLLTAGALWLLAQHSSGSWKHVSNATKAICVLAVVMTISVITSTFISASTQFALRVATAAVAALVAEQLVRTNPERRRHILLAVTVSAIGPLLSATLQMVSGGGNDDKGVTRIRGPFVHPNPFGTYLFIVGFGGLALMWLYPRYKYLAIAVMSGCCVISLFTYTRVTWIAFVVGAVVLGVLQSRRLIWLVVVGVLVVAVAVPSATARLSDLGDKKVAGAGDPNSLEWRISYWGQILPWTADNPITGIGMGGVAQRASIGLPPHNIWVELLVEGGAVGLTTGVVGAWVLGGDLRKRRRIARAAGNRPLQAATAAVIAVAIGLLVQSFSENLLEEAITLVYFFVIVAAVIPEPVTAPSQAPASALPSPV